MQICLDSRVVSAVVKNQSPCVRDVWRFLVERADDQGSLKTSYDEIIKELGWKVGYRPMSYSRKQIKTAIKTIEKIPSHAGPHGGTLQTVTGGHFGLHITIRDYWQYTSVAPDAGTLLSATVGHTVGHLHVDAGTEVDATAGQIGLFPNYCNNDESRLDNGYAGTDQSLTVGHPSNRQKREKEKREKEKEPKRKREIKKERKDPRYARARAREGSAEQIYTHYNDLIDPAQKSRQRALKNISHHMQHYPHDELMAAAENYNSALSKRNGNSRRYRKDPANFYGRYEPAFLDYLPRPGEANIKPKMPNFSKEGDMRIYGTDA